MPHDRKNSSRRAWAALCAAVLAVSGALVGVAAPASAVPATIPLTITNDSGRGPIYLYVLGERDGVAGWADAGGTFHPWPGGVGPVPVPAPDASIAGPGPGQSVTIRLPKLSGRVYYSYGQKMTFQIVLDGRLVQPAVQNDSDPNRNILFNWTEYTLNDGGLWINSTQVDHWSAPYQVGVQRADGQVLSTGMLKPNGYEAFYTALESAGWGGLVQRAPDGSRLRALNPSHGIDVGKISSASIDSYVTEVWNSYRTRDMVVTPFSHEPGTQFRGRVDGDWFRFRNGSGQEVAAFKKPDASSVYGCHKDLQAPNDHVVGPIARTLCAALVRTTALTNPNQPDASSAGFYQDARTNVYAKLAHQQMANGKAYAFAFDDVGAHESLVHDGNPQAAYIKLDPFTGTATPIGNGGSTEQPGTPGGLPAGTGALRIGSTLCLDVPWADPTDTNQVQLATCSGNAAQQWTRGTDGTVRALGKCLDVARSGTADGTAVWIYTCNGTGAQKWTYDSATKALRNPQSGKCLDAQGGAPLRDGQKVQLWTCNQTEAQRWTL
ncbi:beta-1,3-glucanase family protein [Cellulosimicrobium funkei]|uniref:glucan endo-1,3-beta-glucosidase n=1 Tax=Cellulosimicrobium funkei TaxID=264251 RepID=UPI0037562E16